MTIEKVNFGRLEAESDKNLSDYFIDTGVLDRIVSGQRQFIIGRKGSGKTALFKNTEQSRLRRPIIRMDFDDYSWEAHKKLKEEGVFTEAAYQGSWRFTLLMAMLDHLAENGGGVTRKKAGSIRSRLYGKERPRWSEVLFDKFRRLRRLDLPKIEGVGGLGGIEFEEGRDESVLATGFSRWSRSLMTFIKANITNYSVTLFLDRLDDAWDASDESKSLLVGALKAAREINLELGERGTPPPVLVFLRTDIFDLLQFNDKMKMAQDIEYLDWDEGALIKILEARISASLGVEQSKAWASAFSQSPMRQRASIRSYMTRRTMYRPRDIIRFAICCQDVANKYKHKIIETDDVYAGEERYSQETFDELIDEMHKQI